VSRVLSATAEYGRDADSYLLDLEMLVNTPGGRERTASEFRELLSTAGFVMIRTVPTEDSLERHRGAGGVKPPSPGLLLVSSSSREMRTTRDKPPAHWATRRHVDERLVCPEV
jgi:hypothetical protein